MRLTTSLVFMEDDDALTEEGIIRTIYDPTAGTGGFLSSGMEYVHELNPKAVMRAFGQELNPESYAICKGDMLIKGQDVSRIKLGNTLSDDQLYADKFDYMLSNPPFGVDWKKVEGEIKNEHKLKGFDGRFGPGRGGLGELAEITGLSAEDIRAGLAEGNTLAEVVGDQMSEDDLVAALVAAATERIDSAVDAGRIDQERGEELIADLDEKITEMVNRDPADRPEGGHRWPRGGAVEETSATA